MGERIVFVGAGSAMFCRSLAADALAAGNVDELRLVDIDADALAVAERLVSAMISRSGSPLRVTATTDRRDVLGGATAVVTAIGVGGRRAWEQDVLIPREFGVYASVGDTVGPGGASRALRMIPPMVEIARDVEDLAGDAVFLNFGNPLAPVVRAIWSETGIRAAGLCHGVYSTARMLADQLGVPFEALRYTGIGRNHLTWLWDFTVDGKDVGPALRAIANDAPLEPRVEGAARTELIAEAPVETGDPLSWALFRAFGAWPAPGDRHIAEFFPALCPGGAYGSLQLGVHRGAYSFENCIAWGDREYADMRAIADGLVAIDDQTMLSAGHDLESVAAILDSIRRDVGRVRSVNMPNLGAVPGLPDEGVIEAPAAATADGIRFLPQGRYPAALAGTLAHHFEWETLVVEAAVRGDRERFVQALIVDGSVRSVADAVMLADRLLEAHAEYLPWARTEVGT